MNHGRFFVSNPPRAANQKMVAVVSESAPMDDDQPILRYWGKAKPRISSGPQWHPLVYHCLDVAA